MPLLNDKRMILVWFVSEFFFGSCASVFVGGDEENGKENDKKKKDSCDEKMDRKYIY
jgi:hypothetical protein